MGICGPLETESNMFKISIKLILVVAHWQPKGLLHVLSANHCVCVCVSAFQHVCGQIYVCVCAVWAVFYCVCEREGRGK